MSLLNKVAKFLDSVTNFSSTIYLIKRITLKYRELKYQRALEHFNKAIQYSQETSNYYTGYAILYKAHILHKLGQLKLAEKASTNALKYIKNFSEAYYQNAKYNSLLKQSEKAIVSLEKAIKMDVNYCDRCYNDKDFKNIISEMKLLFERLRVEKKKDVGKRYNKIKSLRLKFNKLYQRIKNMYNHLFGNKNIEEIEFLFNQISLLIKRNSYRDYLKADNLILNLSEKLSTITKNIKDKAKNEIIDLKNKNKFSVISGSTLKGLWMILGFPIAMILSIRSCNIERTVENGTFWDGPGAFYIKIITIHIAFVSAILAVIAAFNLLKLPFVFTRWIKRKRRETVWKELDEIYKNI